MKGGAWEWHKPGVGALGSLSAFLEVAQSCLASR